MRPIFVAGNWKMNTTSAEARNLAGAIAAGLGRQTEIRVAVCPPFPYLDLVAKALEHTTVALGAQNLYPERKGAFTGEVSGPMLVDLGCRHVIVGHSERRHILGESDALIHRKVRAALGVGLAPIVCVGELLDQRNRGETEQVISAQLCSAIEGLTDEETARLVFAYEPVWAIGTGHNATPQQAEEVHSHIRRNLAERYNASLAEQAVIQYGGSVNRTNAESLLAQPNVDGALVGGASLRADEFLAIVEAGRRVAERSRMF